MSEILRSIACSVIIVLISMTFTHSALSMDDDNIFGDSFFNSQVSRAKSGGVQPVSEKKVYRKKAVKTQRQNRNYRRKAKRVAAKGKVRRVASRKKVTYKRTAKYSRTALRKPRLKKRTAQRRYKKARVARKSTNRQYRQERLRRRAEYRQKARERRRSRSRVSGRSRFSSLIAKHASNYGVPIQIAHAVVRIESNYRPGVRGGAGEIGLMQIKPATARLMGYRGSTRALYNPDTNLKYGMKYLAGAYRRSGGSVCGTVLRYNAGHGARRMNPISARYCRKAKRIIGRAR